MVAEHRLQQSALGRAAALWASNADALIRLQQSLVDARVGLRTMSASTHRAFAPNEDLPVSKNTYSFEAIDGGTRATFTSAYDSAEGLQQVLEMGVVEGATLAINQIDDLVAA